jgi:cytoskeleton protein RodZ
MKQASAGGVGAGLRRLREERRISQHDIAVATKISPVALEAIERDDITRLPGGIFTRAFVRTYAAHLGLDPDRTLREFVAQFPGAEAEHFPQPAPPPVPEPRNIVARVLVQAGLIGLVLALAVIWLALARSGSSVAEPEERLLAADRIVAARSDVPLLPTVRPVADVVRSAASEAIPAIQEDGPLTIVLTPRANCWVSASADGQPLVERLLGRGEAVVLRARRRVVFKVGDAAAVSMLVNGEIGRELGGPGEVVTTRIESGNYREFLATP